MKVDTVVGLAYGDEGKGKVTHYLLRTGRYDYCVRYNGGCNAGHTIFHNGKKFVTHHIPAGVFFGVKSIIGNGCVVSVRQFYDEIHHLERFGIKTKGLIFIAENAHIITDDNVNEDALENELGTTKRGNGPCYRDKYARVGKRASESERLRSDGYLLDLYEEFYSQEEDIKILCEGAQGFGLDIDWGDYPYVTSSHCTAASACLNAIPPQAIRTVYGVTKAYDTYVGTKEFQPSDEIFNALRVIGEEYGATTGRPRQCNWLDISLLKKAININGANTVIINKVDILRMMGKFAVRTGSQPNAPVLEFSDEEAWKEYIQNELSTLSSNYINVIFSESPKEV